MKITQCTSGASVAYVICNSTTCCMSDNEEALCLWWRHVAVIMSKFFDREILNWWIVSTLLFPLWWAEQHLAVGNRCLILLIWHSLTLICLFAVREFRLMVILFAGGIINDYDTHLEHGIIPLTARIIMSQCCFLLSRPVLWLLSVLLFFLYVMGVKRFFPDW